MLTEEKGTNFGQNLELIRHFREHFAILSDVKAIEMLKVFASSSFRNHEARALLGTSRQATWERLARLVELGFLEKRGQTYKVSPYAKAIVSASSTALRSLLTYKVLAENRSAANELLSLATQGLELMYAKGLIQPVEQARYQRLLAGLAKEIGDRVA
jgi:hypothetical protein